MSEEQIAAAAAPIVEAAVKALTPEAEAALREVHDIASAEFAKLDDSFPQLLKTAETDSLSALRVAEGHLVTVVNAVRDRLGLAKIGAPVDPTPAAPTPQA